MVAVITDAAITNKIFSFNSSQDKGLLVLEANHTGIELQRRPAVALGS